MADTPIRADTPSRCRGLSHAILARRRCAVTTTRPCNIGVPARCATHQFGSTFAGLTNADESAKGPVPAYGKRDEKNGFPHMSQEHEQMIAVGRDREWDEV